MRGVKASPLFFEFDGFQSSKEEHSISSTLLQYNCSSQGLEREGVGMNKVALKAFFPSETTAMSSQKKKNEFGSSVCVFHSLVHFCRYRLQNIHNSSHLLYLQGLIFAQKRRRRKSIFSCLHAEYMHAKLSNYALCSLATMKDDFRRWWLQSSSTVSRVDITHQVGPKIIYVGVRFLSVP